MSAEAYNVFQPLTGDQFIITGDGTRAGVGIVNGDARSAWVIERDEVEAVCAALRKAAGVGSEVAA